MSGSPTTKVKLLFLCTGNSCRSQMAEGWANSLLSNSVEAFSAGTAPKSLNPLAVSVMAEVGIDISKQTCKGLEDVNGHSFDYVITVCSDAQACWPNLGGESKTVNVAFDDPPSLANGIDNQRDVLRIYRRVRDEIKRFIVELPETLLNESRRM